MKKQPVDAKKAAANDKEWQRENHQSREANQARRRGNVHHRFNRHREARVSSGVLRVHPKERSGGRRDAGEGIRRSADRRP